MCEFFSLLKLFLVLSGVKLFALYLYTFFIVAVQSLWVFCDLWHKSCTDWRWPDRCAAALIVCLQSALKQTIAARVWASWGGNAEMQLLQSWHLFFFIFCDWWWANKLRFSSTSQHLKTHMLKDQNLIWLHACFSLVMHVLPTMHLDCQYLS